MTKFIYILLTIYQLDQAWFGMPDRSYYLDDQYTVKLQAYKTLMMKVAIYLGGEQEQAIKDVQDIIDFEIELANVSFVVLLKLSANSFRSM